MTNVLGLQSQIVTDAYRTMVRTTFPSTLKVIVPGGLDAGLLREWRQRRPDGLLVLRHYFPDENLTPTKYAAILAAADPIADLHPILETPVNEAHQTDPDDIVRLADYSAQFVRLAADQGFKTAVGIFGEGNPSDLGWWPRFYPALRAAREHGGYLALHEYGIPSLGFEDWHLLRHRRVWRVLPDGLKVPILVTECGIDGGIEGRREVGWRGYMDARAYADWLRRYRQELAADAYVHGAQVFLCGSGDQWRSFDLGDEVDLRPVFTEPVAGPARWTPPEESTVADIALSVPTRVSLASPDNYQKGPRARTIGVVVHATRGGGRPENEFSSTIAWFSNPDAGVSAHLVVGYTPFDEVARCVHDDDVAWHARTANATHLGIEICQAKIGDPFTPFQYEAAAEAVRLWAAKYAFPVRRVKTITQPGLVGHEDTEPGKQDGKTDPGPLFDWDRFIKLAGGAPVPTTPTEVNALRDKTYALAHQLRALKPAWQAAGYPQTAEGIDAAANAAERFVSTSKGEK